MVLIDDFTRNVEVPSFLWRSTSHQVIVVVAALSRAFLYGFNKTEVHGLSPFLDLLKSRSDYRTRRKGLLTVSNHLSVLDDPLIWGVLPLSFTAYHGYLNFRWTLGSHDICFTNAFRSHFFTLGQVLPTHRYKHSPYGGPEQPAMGEAVKILTRINLQKSNWSPFNAITNTHRPGWPHDPIDPLSTTNPAPYFPSRTDDDRYYLAPSRYACNSYAWVHIFPEGFIHQSKEREPRYFKWGVARLILEPPECPDVVPMFIEGTDNIMNENRTFPRFLPRIANKVVVTFGKKLDTEAAFGDLRERWNDRKEKVLRAQWGKYYQRFADELLLGYPAPIMFDDPELTEIRIECARRVREEILKLRRERGYPEENPNNAVAATWGRDGSTGNPRKRPWN